MVPLLPPKLFSDCYFDVKTQWTSVVLWLLVPLVPSPIWIVMSLLAVISWRLSFCASLLDFFFSRIDMCKGALSDREQVFLNGRTQFFGMHPYLGSMIKYIPADSRTEIVIGIETLGAQGKLCHLCFL